ncbi:MAG: cbb3-type cytochrome c oxidase subunit 3 [Gammaproteobacteria bacterium]|nr:cbb3-type cytochrome c oxidase subunit 3 [Gammaproteobacteria bacterium]
MDAATFHGIWTAVLLIVFIGIIAWAWSGKRKRDFEQAARIPLEEDEPAGRRTDNETDDKGSRDG